MPSRFLGDCGLRTAKPCGASGRGLEGFLTSLPGALGQRPHAGFSLPEGGALTWLCPSLRGLEEFRRQVLSLMAMDGVFVFLRQL